MENEALARARSGELARALATIEELTASQRITQESIDRLLQIIAALPSESRGAVVSFLGGLGSSAWATALIDLLKQVTR